MGNIATSFNEQIALLEKRGMTIDSQIKLKKFFRHRVL
jgi:abortive infection bacteriophage resistance protein